MKIQIATIAAIGLLAGACAPDSDPGERAASRAGQPDRLQSQDDTRRTAPQQGTTDLAPGQGAIDRAPQASPTLASMAATEIEGREVVGAEGDALGRVKNVVRHRKTDQKLAVVAVAATSDNRGSKDVVVPLEKLAVGEAGGTLQLQMSRDELDRQPDADSPDYVESDTRLAPDSAEHLSRSSTDS